MDTKDMIKTLEAIASDTTKSLDDRIDEVFGLRGEKEWSTEIDIECFKMLIKAIFADDAIATHVRELLQLYVLLAETYVNAEIYRPMEELSRDVRGVLRDERIAWDVIDETVPRFIDVMEYTVYHHETYRLLLSFLSIAFKEGKMDKDLKGYVRNLLKLRILLEDPYSWHDHLLGKDMQSAIADLFTKEELLKIILNPNTGHLKCDPVEYTERWEDVYYDVEDYLNERFANVDRHMGFCFMYWSAKQNYLKENYNIDWRTPGQMNPRVMFD